jgi:hypothetical protein
MIELDHVVVAVLDLDDGSRALAEKHGLSTLPGGRHPSWGTAANRIVPLGRAFLELVAVVDERKSARSAFGRWVSSGATATGAPIGWAVRPVNLDVTASRLGLVVQHGSRIKPDGRVLRWRAAGIDEAASDPSLPFFVEWAAASTFPGSLPAGTTPAASISRIDLEGNPEQLRHWLDDHSSLPLRVRPGRSAVRRVVLASAAGEIALGG